MFLVLYICICCTRPKVNDSDITNLKAALDSLVDIYLTDSLIPSIAIGIVRDQEVIISKGYGWSNLEEQTPATDSTIYQLGSVTKMLTGHVLAHLVLNEEINLSQTIHQFYPSIDFPTGLLGQKVRVIDLATHSAQFPRYPTNLNRIDPYPINGYSVEELLKGIQMVQIDTSIGHTYRYSNFGYGVLGTAIEVSQQKDLDHLMAETIFLPYHMTLSSLSHPKSQQDLLATPYLEVVPVTATDPWEMGALSAAGNVFSTVKDLNRFMIQCMKDDSINIIQQTAYLDINDSWSYGLGCFIVDSEKWQTKAIYHGGDIDGYASSLTFYPEFKIGFVFLTNWGEGQVIGNCFSAISSLIMDYLMATDVK